MEIDYEKEHLEEFHRQQEKKNNPIEPNHYVDMKISPLEFIEANQEVLTWCTSNVIKYVGRHQRKNGLEDLKKVVLLLNHLLITLRLMMLIQCLILL